MRIALLFFFILLSSTLIKGQEKVLLKGDLKGAPLLRVNQNYTFSKAPLGFGNTKEFPLNPARSSIIFKEERNTAWFLIEIPFTGVLTFDLSPHQVADDYDWMLYSYSADLEKNIRNLSVKPVRSNNARNNTQLLSKTGLAYKGKGNWVKPGPGNSYVLPLGVKKGERFVLVVDNIYGGKGFDLFVKVGPKFTGTFVELRGKVEDRKLRKGLSAELRIEDDSTGVLISKIRTDPTDGSYQVNVPSGRPLNISALHPSYLFATADTLIYSRAELNFLLDTPVAGIKLGLFNIHFYPNKTDILPESYPELERLQSFMNNNPDWSIKITGHTNTNVFAPVKYLQQLSFNRALAVKNYLVKNQVSDKRISCAGLGGKDPLVITKDPAAGAKNLRVEITLVKK